MRPTQDYPMLKHQDEQDWNEPLMFRKLIFDAEISVRAKNVLSNHIPDIQRFFDISEKELLRFRNCGKKTVREILEFQKNLREQVGYNLPTEEKGEKDISILLKDIHKYDYVFETIKQLLSERARKVLSSNNIDSLSQFMALSEQMKQMRNCGKTTIREYKKYQKSIFQMLQKIETYKKSQELSAEYIPISSLVYSFFETELLETSDFINLDTPFPSLEKWVSDISQKEFRKGEQAKKVFMLRMGMLGEPPKKLEEISDYIEDFHGRERPRQILEKMEEACRYQINQRKLQPLIQRAGEIITSRGGKIKKTELVSLLLVHGPDGENLRFATTFIDFLGTLSVWKNAGLTIGKDNTISIESCDDLTKQLSSVLESIARQNADEVINENLWSVDYRFLKKLATDWINTSYPEKKLLELSDAILFEVLSRSPSKLKHDGGRVYPYDLWAFRCDKITHSVEILLKTSKKAMHFSEVYSELKRYRPNLSEHNAYTAVYPKLERNENLFLWGRGIFIHKTCVSIPYELINEIEGWILEQLRKEVPFIAVYGPFNLFEKKCLESNIPNEYALYSLLRELSHPLIAYPRCPYIYSNKGNVTRIPVPLAIEQFIQNYEGPVSYEELKSYAFNRLFLKDIQLVNIIPQLPNTIRTEDGGVLHTDYINFDAKRFDEIVQYTRKLIAKEGHVSIVKVFEDKKLSCKILGIDSPQGLFSLFKLKAEDEFDFPQYPQISILSADDVSKEKGIINDIVSFIKEQGTFCSYQKLQEVFVDKLGYKESTIYLARNRNEIYSYGSDCVIHQNTIQWNDEKQEQIENAAMKRYKECVRCARYYGQIKEMIEFDHLPDLGNQCYWTAYLLADLLVIREHFKILGSERNAFVPIPNQYGIEIFEDLVYEILKGEFGGGANLNQFAEYLREAGIIRKSLTESMLAESRKVKILDKEIVMRELIDNA